MALEITA